MTLLWNENPIFSLAVRPSVGGFHQGYENPSHVHTWKHALWPPGRKSAQRPWRRSSCNDRPESVRVSVSSSFQLHPAVKHSEICEW